MNSDFDAFADQIAAAARWETGAAMSHEFIAAYQHAKDHMKITADSNDASTNLVLAGTHACVMALMVTSGVMPDETLARAVLNDWGIKAEPKPELPPNDTLVWPPVDLSGRPLAAALSPVYFKARYHVREPITQIDSAGTGGYTIHPDHPLTLTEAYWDETRYTWRMCLKTQHAELDPIWMGHCNLKPTKEAASPGTIDIPAGAGL